jgi:hypothetical protein
MLTLFVVPFVVWSIETFPITFDPVGNADVIDPTAVTPARVSAGFNLVDNATSMFVNPALVTAVVGADVTTTLPPACNGDPSVALMSVRVLLETPVIPEFVAAPFNVPRFAVTLPPEFCIGEPRVVFIVGSMLVFVDIADSDVLAVA